MRVADKLCLESLRNESVERYAGGGRFHLSPQAREVSGQVVGRLDGPAGARAGRTPPAGAARVAALLFGPADLAPPAGGLRAGGQVRELDEHAMPGGEHFEEWGGVAIRPVDRLQDCLAAVEEDLTVHKEEWEAEAFRFGLGVGENCTGAIAQLTGGRLVVCGSRSDDVARDVRPDQSAGLAEDDPKFDPPGRPDHDSVVADILDRGPEPAQEAGAAVGHQVLAVDRHHGFGG